ncbi:MAG: acetyl-CoA carboxylase biotin carboxyl carrier protein [Pseudomonadota bacterium]
MAREKNQSNISSDQETIRELAELLHETGLSEIEIERSGLRLRVAKSMTISAAAVGTVPGPMAVAPTAGAPDGQQMAAAADKSSHPGAVKSPMVGTVYRSPEPNAASFVEVGATVSEGQTVLIIEAMKTMNHIKAPRSGTVKEILVENEQPVEFGEALLIIE